MLDDSVLSVVNEEELTINDTPTSRFREGSMKLCHRKLRETLKQRVVAPQSGCCDRTRRLISSHCCKQICCRKVAYHILASRCKFQLI